MKKTIVTFVSLLLASASWAQGQQRLEYFLDTDPGYGQGQAIEGLQAGSNELSLDLSNASSGAHLLSVRCRDEQGRWSATLSRPFYVCAQRGISVVEYFFDADDPGEGKANLVEVSAPGTCELSFDIDIDALEEGDHTLCVRAKGLDGLWSLLSKEPFAVTKNSDGISTVSFTMPFRVSMANRILTIEGIEGGTKGDCQIEVFDLSGMRVASAVWPSALPKRALSVGKASVVMVKVTDLHSKQQLVKRLTTK